MVLTSVGGQSSALSLTSERSVMGLKPYQRDCGLQSPQCTTLATEPRENRAVYVSAVASAILSLQCEITSNQKQRSSAGDYVCVGSVRGPVTCRRWTRHPLARRRAETPATGPSHCAPLGCNSSASDQAPEVVLNQRDRLFVRSSPARRLRVARQKFLPALIQIPGEVRVSSLHSFAERREF